MKYLSVTALLLVCCFAAGKASAQDTLRFRLTYDLKVTASADSTAYIRTA